jgi:hypothetical protein
VKKHTKEFHSRRELFAGALRYAALGLMAAVSTALIAKRQRLVRNGQCVNSGICAGCKILKNCSLPQAASARETLSGINNDTKRQSN